MNDIDGTDGFDKLCFIYVVDYFSERVINLILSASEMITKTSHKAQTQGVHELTVLHPNMMSAMFGKIVGALIVLVPMFILFLVLLIAGGASGLLFLPFFFFLLLGFGLPIFFSYMDLRRREYRFFSDKLEYYDGWLVRRRHVVPYAKVTDITMQETLWNRFFRTATITLITPAGVLGSTAIPHIANAEEVYNYLQKEVLKVK